MISKNWMTYQEAAEYLGISIHTIKKYVQDGRLKKYVRFKIPYLLRSEIKDLNDPKPVAKN